jgi:hypothetical protein
LAGSCDTCKETSGFVRRAGTVLANWAATSSSKKTAQWM